MKKDLDKGICYDVNRCPCGERLRTKVGGCQILTHTRWNRERDTEGEGREQETRGL